MARKRETPITTDSGALTCQKCGCPMQAMVKGGGFRCSAPGNRWQNGAWSVCDYVWFPGRGARTVKPPVVRPTTFPNVPQTEQQQAIVGWLKMECRSRTLMVDADAGCSKTTSGALVMEEACRRFRGASAFCFNVNAREAFQAKTPDYVNVQTLNSYGYGCLRADRPGVKVVKSKLREAFKELVSSIPYKERPSMSPIKDIVERSRDLCLYESDPSNWGNIIQQVVSRFPSLSKAYDTNADAVHDYCGQVSVNCFVDRSTCDLSEQWSRFVSDAIQRTGFRLNPALTERRAEWSQTDVDAFAAFAAAIRVPSLEFVFLDESQDWSLGQIAFVLATAKKGTLVYVGDDKRADAGDAAYKSGQGIYGWRGALPGGMTLIARIREVLNGEPTDILPLSETFRCRERIVSAVRPLSSSLTSRKPGGIARQVRYEQAFAAFCDSEKPVFAIARTNKAVGEWLRECIRAKVPCTLRGESLLEGIDSVLYNCAGWRDESSGEFKCSLPAALARLSEIIAEQEDDRDTLERLVFEIAEELRQETAATLAFASLTGAATVGNLRRIFAFLCNATSHRCVTNVYRVKGEEAPLVVVFDTAKFNEAWNNDSDEAAAARYVAITRASDCVLTTGPLCGIEVDVFDGEDPLEPDETTPE